MWTPHQKLTYYTAHQQRRQVPAGQPITRKRLLKRSYRQACSIADAAIPDSRRVDDEFVDPKGATYDVTPMSRQLDQFLRRGLHHSRQVLEELLLVHYMNGHGLVDAVSLAYEDYSTVGDEVAPLGPMDVLNFAAFTWDWSTAGPMTQDDYAQRALSMGSPLHEIYVGDRSLSDVRIDYGAVRGFEAGKEIQRMAMINAKTAQQIARELREKGTMEDHRAFKDISSFQNTAVAVMKAAEELGSSEEEALSLGDYFDEMWEEEVDHDIRDYRDMEAPNITPEDLQAENDAADAESDIDMLDDVDWDEIREEANSPEGDVTDDNRAY